jgi:hypothetical protein
MTPLLWMQYAYDAACLANMAMEKKYGEEFTIDALEMGLQILELGLQQFPGCAVLHLLHVQWCKICYHKDTSNRQHEWGDKWSSALESAIDDVASGSHRNEGPVVAEIWKNHAENIAQFAHETSEAILEAFWKRAKCPMNHDLNASLLQEYHDFCSQQSTTKPLSHASQTIEDGRKYESIVFSRFQTYEDDVTVAMQQERVLSPVLQNPDAWKSVQQTLLETDLENNTSWMGLGGVQTAQAFVSFAQACSRYKNQELPDAQLTLQKIAIKVYERGVAECPTVETLWLSFLSQLKYWMRAHKGSEAEENRNQYKGLLQQASRVAVRAVRNCPYSVTLVKEKLNIMLLMTDAGMATLDPEELYKTTILQQVIGNKFIVGEQQILELFLSTTQVVRRRILAFLVAMAPTALQETSDKKSKKMKNEKPPRNFDDPQPIAMPTVSTDDSEDEERMQELEDLCTDLREIYEDMDEYLRKNHQKFKEGRAKLWKDRGWTETHLVGPIMACFDEVASASIDTARYAEVTKAFDKATKVSLPVHPGVFCDFIHAFLASYPVTKIPYHVMMKLRQVRHLYQAALKSIGKPRDKNNGATAAAATTSLTQSLDYETALRCLCHDYLEFEQYFGSGYSHADACKAVQKKLSRAFGSSEHDHMEAQETTIQKRKHSDDNAMDGDEAETVEPSTKKQKTDNAELPKTTLSVTKPLQHKVKVGDMEYPAHPYTIRVSFLSPKTQDMDLVDVFRPRCGGIVHAKIMREKQHGPPHEKSKSKGWGLVQFEEKESVEKALGLSDVIGIDEKSVKIERSHLPAVGLVPPGMHRINPKGHGKSTKRNQKRKTQLHEANSKEGGASDAKPAAVAASSMSFLPRTVSKAAKPKAKISVPKSNVNEAADQE